jgi:hypothetical protein
MPDRSDRNREPDGFEFGGEDAGPKDIDKYAARAALDDSGVFYRLLGKDTDDRGHYVKKRDVLGKQIVGHDVEAHPATVESRPQPRTTSN